MTHEKGVYEKYIKRPQDILCASLAFVVLSPLMAVIAILVKTNLGSPVLFEQDRPGEIDPKSGRERIFKLYKFRTMTDEKGSDGELLSDGDRLTRFGRLLRSTSMDELPELINIIKGDMSIVGPRPLLVKYIPRYNNIQRRRHEVKPGITGLAQVNGRNAISWEEKFALDVEYVDSISFKNDWIILFKTIGAVVKRKGINSDSSETMEEFMGTNYK